MKSNRAATQHIKARIASYSVLQASITVATGYKLIRIKTIGSNRTLAQHSTTHIHECTHTPIEAIESQILVLISKMLKCVTFSLNDSTISYIRFCTLRMHGHGTQNKCSQSKFPLIDSSELRMERLHSNVSAKQT